MCMNSLLDYTQSAFNKCTSIAKDTLCRLNLSLSKLQGQCYNGASTVRGARSGVATRIMDEESSC